MDNIFYAIILLSSISSFASITCNPDILVVLTASYPTSLNLALASTDVDSVTLTWTSLTSQTLAHYEVSMLAIYKNKCYNF